MIKRIRQMWASPTVRMMLIICTVCLFLSACGGGIASYDQSDWTPDYKNCYSCVLYEASFEVIEYTLINLIQTTCPLAMTVLGFGLLFWILFRVLTLFSVKEPKLREFLLGGQSSQGVLTTFFKAIIVVALIRDANVYINFIGENIVQPLLLFFAEVSRAILLSDEMVSDALVTPQDISGKQMVRNVASLFGDAPVQILDIIYHIFVALYTGIGLSITILQQSGIVATLFGIGIFLLFTLLLLIFPITFIDGFFQVCGMLILSPFALVGWIFPPTKKILVKVFNVLLGAMFNILFGCIHVSLMIYVLVIGADSMYPGILGTARQTADPNLIMGIKTLSTNALGFFILIIAMGLLSGSIPKLAQQLTQTSAQSGGIIKSFNQAVNITYKAGRFLVKGGASAVDDIKKGVSKK